MATTGYAETSSSGRSTHSQSPIKQMNQPNGQGKGHHDARTGSRKRHRALPKESQPAPFRIDFECVHTGRYIASTKRRIKWRFGFASGVGVPHDQHEVELVWSVKSGKTRLYWNKEDISALFHNRNQRGSHIPSAVEFKWQSVAGTVFVVSAHAQPVAGCTQYNCLVDGVDFSSLPNRAAVEKKLKNQPPPPPVPLPPPPPTPPVPAADNDVPSEISSGDVPDTSYSLASGGGTSSGQDALRPDAYRSQHRLAAAGFTCQFDMEDELRSELYSPTLDLLRDEVAASVPETEEMMSRAIIAAFSEDHDSDTSHDSTSDTSEKISLDPPEVEADVIGEALEWSRWSRKFVPVMDTHDSKLEFMQKHVETMVAHVRHDRLSPQVASNIMLRVATLLRFDVTKQPKKDTVVVLGMGSDATPQDLLNAMNPHGEIEALSLSVKNDGFGLCRFGSEQAASRACLASFHDGVVVAGKRASVYKLFEMPILLEESPNEERVMPAVRDENYNEYYASHVIDPSDDAIEATYVGRRGVSMTLSDLSASLCQNSNKLEPQSKVNGTKHPSSSTVSTLSLDVDELNLH